MTTPWPHLGRQPRLALIHPLELRTVGHHWAAGPTFGTMTTRAARGVLGGVALALTMVPMVVGCSAGQTRGTATITNYIVSDEGSLSVIVNTCHGDPVVSALVETTDEVKVAVTSTKTNGAGDACLDSVDVDLSAPLGDRTVIDASDGHQVVDQEK